MLLNDKNAVIYGAGGFVGNAVAKAFAREGARVFLTGRSTEKLKQSAGESEQPVGMLSMRKWVHLTLRTLINI